MSATSADDVDARLSLAGREAQEAMHRYGRNSAPGVLLDFYFDDEWTYSDLAVLVPHAWSMAEYPLQSLESDDWRDLFRDSGYTYGGRRRDRPRKPMKLYRGATAGQAQGWSWTRSLATAQWFADRVTQQGQGRVWTATVEPLQMLAYIGDEHRGESEMVVDPQGLVVQPYCRDGATA